MVLPLLWLYFTTHTAGKTVKDISQIWKRNRLVEDFSQILEKSGRKKRIKTTENREPFFKIPGLQKSYSQRILILLHDCRRFLGSLRLPQGLLEGRIAQHVDQIEERFQMQLMVHRA